MFDLITINSVQIKIGNWCKKKRQSDDLSQEKLANLLGLSRITIQKLENGKNVTTDTLLKVVNHFDKLQDFNQLLDTALEENEPISLY